VDKNKKTKEYMRLRGRGKEEKKNHFNDFSVGFDYKERNF
jgi:hypothetical protein